MTTKEWKPGITKLPEQKCLRCGVRLNATGPTTGPEPGVTPRPGDPSICIKCGAVYTYAEDLSFRPFTEEEWEDIQKDQELLLDMAKAVGSIHAMIAGTTREWKPQ